MSNSIKKTKTLFLGTSEFARVILDKLLHLEYIEIVGVITKPDALVGRKQVLEPCAVGKFVNEYNSEQNSNIPIFKPEKFKEEYQSILEGTKPELAIVAAYGKILPEEFLNCPKYKCLNIHGSLLPKLRGATPIQSAILHCFEKTGISIQIMKYALDEGDIIGEKEISLKDRNYYKEDLFQELSIVGSNLLEEILPKYINGEILPRSQKEEEATYCSKEDFLPEKGELFVQMSAQEIEGIIKSFTPEPSAFITEIYVSKIHTAEDLTTLDKEHFTRIPNRASISRVGTFSPIENAVPSGFTVPTNNLFELTNTPLIIYQKNLYLLCKDGLLEVLELQLESEKKKTAKEFINGAINKLK